MPIPDDPLSRWWVECAAENPTRVEELRPVLLALMAFGPGREPSLVGSGFIIAGSSEFALAITAKHVLEGVGKVQRPWSRQAPSALFVSSGAPALSLDPYKLKLVWMGSRHADMLNVGHVGCNATLDVACCVVTPQEGEALGFQPIAIPIDTAVPEVGELIHMVSLDALTINEHVPPTDASGVGQIIGVHRRVGIRIGVVTGVYPTGLRHYRWPCFTTSVPVEPGMSGGFVTLPREGKAIAACGIVCADNSPDAARASFHQCGESIIACAWPALALRAPNSMPSTPSTLTLTLYELMRTGRMDRAVGGIDDVEISERDNGDCVIRMRR